MTPATSLPPDVLFALVVVLGVAVVVIGGGFVLVALRPSNIKADRGGKVDYSPRAKVEVTRSKDDEP